MRSIKFMLTANTWYNFFCNAGQAPQHYEIIYTIPYCCFFVHMGAYGPSRLPALFALSRYVLYNIPANRTLWQNIS